MEKFKISVEIVGSLASLIAIFTVLIAWWNAKRPPLKITQGIIGGYGDDIFEFTLRIKNVKPIPVKVKHVSCYKKENIRLEKRSLEIPRYEKVMDARDKIFSITVDKHISELGEYLLVHKLKAKVEKPKYLMVMLDTSHGYLWLKCKNIHYYNPTIVTVKIDYSDTVQNYFLSSISYLRCLAVFFLDKSKFKFPKIRKALLPNNDSE